MGVPVVASDYDGYRDLVEDGITGLLVPTIGPAATESVNALAPLVFDSEYHLLLAQQTAVRVPELARALGRLIADPKLRATMGAAARQRVLRHFSWPAVIQSHLRLWDGLWRTDVDESAARATPHPLHMDYGRVFASYPSQVLGDALTVRVGRTGQNVYRGKDFPLVYAGMDEWVDQDALRRLLFLARKPVSAADLVRQLPLEVGAFLVLWALKHDLLEAV